jgi:hypothetical protein
MPPLLDGQGVLKKLRANICGMLFPRIRTRCRFADASNFAIALIGSLLLSIFLRLVASSVINDNPHKKAFIRGGEYFWRILPIAAGLDPITNIEFLDSVYIPRQICFYGWLARRLWLVA